MEFQQPVTIEGEIKGGGLGQLLRCVDAAGRRFVAKFPKDFSAESQAMVRDEERRLRRYQGQYIVRYLGPVQLADGRMGYAMEEMVESLASVMGRRGALSEVTALEHIRAAAAGLLEVHRSARGAFHGDVKPANILVSGATTKLADLGLARGGHGQTMMVGPHTGGTPGYMPPEGYASAAGDVYSLGATFVALLTGQEAGSAMVVPAGVSGDVRGLLCEMLDADPHRRLTIEQVAKRLRVLFVAAQARRASWIADAAGGVALALLLVVGVPLLVARIAKSR